MERLNTDLIFDKKWRQATGDPEIELPVACFKVAGRQGLEPDSQILFPGSI
jgi:hypothetical protein